MDDNLTQPQNRTDLQLVHEGGRHVAPPLSLSQHSLHAEGHSAYRVHTYWAQPRLHSKHNTRGRKLSMHSKGRHRCPATRQDTRSFAAWLNIQ